MMKNERILSYQLSNKINQEDLTQVSAAGITSTVTYQSTLSANSMDHQFDYIPDAA
jgi:hypothetical protein